MCGIAGILRLGDNPITTEQVNSLLLGLQHRGGDATGIALLSKDKTLSYHKNDSIAWKFCAEPPTVKFLTEKLPDAEVVILHTRAATQGAPWKYANNHPLTIGKVAVVHNGMIHNDNDIFRDMKLKREAETDSDAIRAVLDEYGLTPKGVKMLNKLRGSAAIACISSEEPNKLLLARSGSPLILGHTEDQLMWASVKDPIHKAARTWKLWRGIYFQATKPTLMFNPFMEDEAFILDIDKMREDPDNYTPWNGEFKTCQHYNKPTYKVHENYFQKRKNFAEQKQREQVQEVASETPSEADRAGDNKTTKDTSDGSLSMGRTIHTETFSCKCGSFKTVEDGNRRYCLDCNKLRSINVRGTVPIPGKSNIVKCARHDISFEFTNGCPECRREKVARGTDINVAVLCNTHKLWYSDSKGCPKCAVEKETGTARVYAEAEPKKLMQLSEGDRIECEFCGKLHRIGKATAGASIWELACRGCGALMARLDESVLC